MPSFAGKVKAEAKNVSINYLYIFICFFNRNLFYKPVFTFLQASDLFKELMMIVQLFFSFFLFTFFDQLV